MADDQKFTTTVYDLDYFSGSQMFLYIGDVWVDEVTALSYSITQDKSPLFGYASQLTDCIAPGRVIVNGQFAINYKEQGYLWAVLRRYFQLSGTAAGIGGSEAAEKALMNRAKMYKEENGKITQAGASTDRPLVGSNGTAISRASIESLMTGDVSTTQRYKFYNDLAGYATVSKGTGKDKIFEDLMEVFEDQVWGSNTDNNTLNSQLRRMDDNKFDGFDIYVVFGNYANPGANHTVQKIIGVHLTSQEKTIQIDGQPVQEVYRFLAKTVA